VSALVAPSELVRPRERGDCAEVARPCPWVTCREHIVHLRATAGLTDEQVLDTLDGLAASCVLDVADGVLLAPAEVVEGEEPTEGRVRSASQFTATLEEVGQLLGVTRERVRQIEEKALGKLVSVARREGLSALDALGRCEADELPTPSGRTRTRAALAEASRGWEEAPAVHRHLPLLGAVEAGGRFWCGRLRAAVTTGTCLGRQVARYPTGGGRFGGTAPQYRDCAECSEGASLAARLRGESAPAPAVEAAPAVPASAVRWFGDDEGADAAADEEANTAPREGAQEHVSMESNNTASTAENNTTEDATPPRVCAAHGCSFEVPPPRTDTRPEVADLCVEHRMLARRIQHNRGLELAVAAQQLREHGYTLLAPAPARAPAPVRSVSPRGCPVPGCGEPSAAALPTTAAELKDLCKLHRTRARDLIFKLPEYTPALARERVVTGQRPAALAPVLSASERGARGGKARTKTLRPAVAETVRRVPAAPVVPAPAPVLAALAPAGSPLGERVAVVRRLVACEARAGGVDVVERLVELADRYGADEIVALVNAAYGGAA
jgi:hypothetical protein